MFKINKKTRTRRGKFDSIKELVAGQDVLIEGSFGGAKQAVSRQANALDYVVLTEGDEYTRPGDEEAVTVQSGQVAILRVQ